jgi:hypothetical protein
MKPGPKPGTGGAPRKEIDFELFERYCSILCTQVEIADLFGISVDSLSRRVEEHYGATFAETYAKKCADGKMSLRRAQHQTAVGRPPIIENGQVIVQGTPPNPTMLIWLGKNHLGQKDKSELEIPGGIKVFLDSKDKAL